ncbi:MAG TPA: M17 family peptidase N-terminal domain-containing protein [Patescibacteria group bacterium]|nr:M17 family peptidase N-terminal domain-containing protein [Patescibacteria group bacterium]
MKVRVVTDQPWDVRADVLAIPVTPELAFDGALGELDRRSGGELRAQAAFGELTGARDATAVAAAGDLPVGRLLAVGTGPPADLDREAVVHLGATIERRLGGRPVRTLAIFAANLAELLDGGAATVAEMLARGVVEGSFDPAAEYRAAPKESPPALDELILVAPGFDAGTLTAAAERGVVIGEGTNLARRLANRAANDVSPEVLADEARAIAAAHGLWIDVIDEVRAAELGMGMFLAVGRGSANPPRMIVLRSGGEGEKDALGRHLALVGKGVTFDSGGISIKPAERMEEMKMDKAGACTVLAAAATVARLAPGTPLLAVAPAVENMPGPHSTRPGDVVTALNGKTVDIINTDAEGRLILGDAMTYAERLGATHLVDVATLTGAIARVFGHLVSGGFGTPQAWYDEVAAAAGRAGERVWQLPLVEEYWQEMESWYADMSNVGSSADGGLIRSALFLRQFVTVPWVHLDIAGTACFRKATPWAARGATGASTATLVELALAGAR